MNPTAVKTEQEKISQIAFAGNFKSFCITSLLKTPTTATTVMNCKKKFVSNGKANECKRKLTSNLQSFRVMQNLSHPQRYFSSKI